jgi:hypothetical protein
MLARKGRVFHHERNKIGFHFSDFPTIFYGFLKVHLKTLKHFYHRALATNFRITLRSLVC